MPKGEPTISSVPRRGDAEAQRIERACVASGVGIYEFDIDRQEGVWGVGLAELLGVDAPAHSVDLGMIARSLHPDDRELAMGRMTAAMQVPGPFDMLHRVLRADGKVIWVRDRGCVYFDVDDRGIPNKRAVGTLVDTTAEVEARDRLNTIAGEMRHRSKNLLTVVTSLVRLMRSAPHEDFRTELIGRLRSLAASQDLTESAMGRVDMRALCRSQLAPIWDGPDGRLVLTGDDVVLLPDAAEPIGMALYELLTNAMKHGALSNDTGTVALDWATDGDRFVLSWRECGGPPPDGAQEPGFGTHIIRDFVGTSLGGQIEVEIAPDGMMWRLDAPAGGVLAS